MKISKIIKKLEFIKIENECDCNINCICHDSKSCVEGSLFICINGDNYRGEDFVKFAVKNGAKVVVTENYINDIDCMQIIVKNSRIAMTEISRIYYDYPDNFLKIITIVGTNGKTTTSMVLCKILKEFGKKCGVIGTNGIYMGDLELPSELTTPDPIELYYILDKMRMLGFEYVIMEASAHAIFLNKLNNLKSCCSVFTNISNEHLDFFKDLESYAKVKLNFINNKLCEHMIINIDDDYGKSLVKNAKIPFSTYGIFNPASTFAINIKTSMKGSSFIVNSNDDIFKITTKLVGDFNVYNILGAISCCKYLGVSTRAIINGILKMERVDGRFNIFELKGNKKVVVDFAHTPDGFDKTLGLIKKLRKGKIVTLFGCVGYSDSLKRTEMGKIASKYSNRIIISVDNPKTVDFNNINSDIIKGIREDVVVDIIYDRSKAIEFGLQLLKNNDTLVLLGKGAEKYQNINNEMIYYNELEFVNKLVNK